MIFKKKCPLGNLNDSMEFGTLGKRLTDILNNIINLFVSTCMILDCYHNNKILSSAAML